MRAALFLAACLGLGACTTTFEGEAPSNLYGQHLDAAVGLYGRWDEQFVMDGKIYYLWRRRVTQEDGDRFCELRLEVTPQRVIARRLMQGYPAACDLFTTRMAPI
jgi:hypothetical protein